MRRLTLVTLALLLAGAAGPLRTAFAAGAPSAVAVWTGTPQSAAVNSAFLVRLAARVTDAATNGVPGVTVTFTAPASGASGTFAGAPTANVVTDSNGLAVAPVLTANGLGGGYTLIAIVSGLSSQAVFSLTNTGGGGGGGVPQSPANLRMAMAGGTPSSIVATAGTPQSRQINTTFSTLQALVRDSSNNPVSGVSVTFAAPSGGASALFGGTTTATVTTDGSGFASASPLTANGAAGTYAVTATAAGVSTPTSFTLTNTTGSGGGPGTWTNVTPGNANLTSQLDCGNFGTQTVVADPARPSNLYAQFNCQGVWKSTDYGLTWTGPINTGSGGAGAKGAGGIAIAPGASGQPPILYSAGIRGSGMGFWRSLDGGVSWTQYNIAPGGSRQDFYAPVVDPYNGNHLIMNGHEMNLIVQSFDGGQTWTNVPMAGGMNENGGTGFLFFVDTGVASTTATTWLWTAQGTGGGIGTWRTTNGGGSWTKVDNNEHPHGEMQIYQPDTNGVVYMAGLYSASGWGVLRSVNYGQTWTHVGNSGGEAIVFGTPNKVYAMYSWACGGCTVDPAFQSAPQPGTSGWTSVPSPAGMVMGPAQTATVFDGTRWVVIGANWMAGLWRFVEQ